MSWSTSSPSLGEAIAGLQDKFVNLTKRLRDADREIANLKDELASTLDLPERDLSDLRRNVAFYCHPDRGGDDAVMRRLNALFDFIEMRGRSYDNG